MTTRRIKIIWIDDESIHAQDAGNLHSRNKNLVVSFSPPEEFRKHLAEKPRPDLFLIDDRLTGSGYRRRGLSVAAEAREMFPEVPVYLFSAYPEGYGIRTDLAQIAESIADEILDIKKIQREGHIILYKDALDYRRIRRSPRHSMDAICRLLDSPKDDFESIVKVLPSSLRSGLSRPSDTTNPEGNTIALAKWVKGVFLRLPGFVLDSLFSATRLGMTEEAFRRHSGVFEGARYRGIFAQTRRELWWASELRRIVYACARSRLCIKNHMTIHPQNLVEMLFRLKNSDTAKCIVCNEKYPDTVGVDRDDEEDRRPVHYRCSITHPSELPVLGFERIRQFQVK